MDSKQLSKKISDFWDDKFALGPKGIIGIDIGLTSVKMADVIQMSDGNYKLNSYASIDLPEGTIIEDEIQKEDDLIAALQRGLKELNSKNKWAAIGLAGSNTLIKRLQIPGGTKEEIEDSVNWEIEQYLPFPIDEGNISFSILGENKGGGVDVIIGAARKSVIQSFKDVVERVDLRVKFVDLNAAAFLNVFEYAMNEYAEKPNSSWILMDLGAQRTQFFIYKNNVMVFYKDVPIGGLTITEEIQRQLGVNYQEAESLKIHGDGNGNIPEEIIEIINQVLDTFFAEVKKTIDFWMSSSADESFEGVIITGGGALIPGVVEALQDLLSLDVHVLNPFSRMIYNLSNINEESINDIAYRGTCALGLAMRKAIK